MAVANPYGGFYWTQGDDPALKQAIDPSQHYGNLTANINPTSGAGPTMSQSMQNPYGYWIPTDTPGGDTPNAPTLEKSGYFNTDQLKQVVDAYGRDEAAKLVGWGKTFQYLSSAYGANTQAPSNYSWKGPGNLIGANLPNLFAGKTFGQLADPTFWTTPAAQKAATQSELNLVSTQKQMADAYKAMEPQDTSGWTDIRDTLESAAVLAGNYFYPGSSVLTSKLASSGSQAQLGSEIGTVLNIGTGIAGGASEINSTGNTGGAIVGTNGIVGSTGNPVLDSIANSAAKGAGTAAATGGNPLVGAVTGGVSGGLSASGGITGLTGVSTGSATLDRILNSSLGNGIKAGMSGGDIVKSIASGAVNGSISSLPSTGNPILDNLYKTFTSKYVSNSLLGNTQSSPPQATVPQATIPGSPTPTKVVASSRAKSAAANFMKLILSQNRK